MATAETDMRCETKHSFQKHDQRTHWGGHSNSQVVVSMEQWGHQTQTCPSRLSCIASVLAYQSPLDNTVLNGPNIVFYLHT